MRQWSPRVEARFLATLAATCNVKAACARAGLTAASAYNHRKRWLGFAARWDAAIEEGYARLEAGLVAHTCNVFSGEAGEGAEPAIAPPITAAQAIHLLHMNKHRVHGIGKAPGKAWRRPPSLDDPGMREGILRKFEMMLAAEDVAADQRERDEAEWAKRRRPADASR